jgi:hypothetical protein
MTAATRKAAQQRIRRLRKAIGPGPHGLDAAELDRQLRYVLEAIGDEAAVKLVEEGKA